MTARIVFALFVALAATLSAGPLLAQTNVGVVDFELVFRTSTRAQAAFADVEAFRARKAGELKTMTEAFQSKRGNLQTNAALSESERAGLAQELRTEQTRIQRVQEDAEREGQRLTNQALVTLEKELAPLVRELAGEMNLQLILQAGPEAGIVFADATIDVTAAVIAKLDAQQP